MIIGTYLVGGQFQQITDVILLIAQGLVDCHGSFGHIRMVVLLQGLYNGTVDSD